MPHGGDRKSANQDANLQLDTYAVSQSQAATLLQVSPRSVATAARHRCRRKATQSRHSSRSAPSAYLCRIGLRALCSALPDGIAQRSVSNFRARSDHYRPSVSSRKPWSGSCLALPLALCIAVSGTLPDGRPRTRARAQRRFCGLAQTCDCTVGVPI